MKRRTLIIIASAIVLVGLAALVYFLVAGRSSELEVGNPFDNLGSDSVAPDSNLPTGVPISDAGDEIAPRLIRIASGPVVPDTIAFTISATSTGTTSPASQADTEIRFIERASGNVYAYRAHERTLTRLSNRTLPGIQEASWLTDGSMAYVRFLTSTPDGEVVDTYALQAEGEEGFFLEKGLSIVETHGTRLLFTLLGSSTGSTGTIAEARSAVAPKTLFTSPLASIRFYLADNRYFAATRASAQLDGYAFIVSPVSGTFSRVIGPYRGLSILPSPSGNNVLYSFMDRGTLRLGIIDIETRTATPLPVATLADKCVWSLDEQHIYCGVPRGLTGSLPDEWYQGVVRFSDRIWSIDLAVRVATLVIDPAEVAETDIDAVGLSLDAKDDMLTFIDRVTGALYAYDL
jgi:hypothetical protein